MNDLNSSHNLAARRRAGCFERAHVFRGNHPRILSPSERERTGILSFISHPRAMKTTWPILLGLLLLAAPAAVQAQDAYSTNADGSIYTYSTNADDSANIVAYAGPPWVVTIPTNINGLTVTSIGTNAFKNNTNLISVTIPNSVTSIGDYAFDYCTRLTSVTIPNSVISIGDFAFEECYSLTSVTIPNSVTSIGEAAFIDCYSLTSLTIPNSVTSIGYYAFYNCVGLTSVTIGNSVTSIGGGAFEYCSSLTSVTIPNSVTNIGAGGSFGAFEYCTSLTSVTIGNSVTSIVARTFAGCSSLRNVTIPDRVTSIGVYAFAGTSLTSVIIPNSVTSIGGYAFENCYSLTSVHFTGNSPSPTNDSTVFSGDPATVYYLPGTTGWGAMFDGRPTAPWFLPNPLILDHSAGFGVQPGGFGFTISWATNVSVVVQAATNLANPVWIPVSTNTLTGGTNYFSDPQWTNYPGRFYRVRSSP